MANNPDPKQDIVLVCGLVMLIGIAGVHTYMSVVSFLKIVLLLG